MKNISNQHQHCHGSVQENDLSVHWHQKSCSPNSTKDSNPGPKAVGGASGPLEGVSWNLFLGLPQLRGCLANPSPESKLRCQDPDLCADYANPPKDTSLAVFNYSSSPRQNRLGNPSREHFCQHDHFLIALMWHKLTIEFACVLLLTFVSVVCVCHAE